MSADTARNSSCRQACQHEEDDACRRSEEDDEYFLADDRLQPGEPDDDCSSGCWLPVSTDHPDGTELHRLAFDGDLQELARAIRDMGCDLGQFIDVQDRYGNTALHVAVMRGHYDCVTLLTSAGANVRLRNCECWSPICEAVSYGDRRIILHLTRRLHNQLREMAESRRQDLVALLKSLPDFFLEIKWDFLSWVPLLSRLLPRDVCRLYKKGAKVRMDSTLVDFEDMRWQRGDVSFLYNGEERSRHAFVMLDNEGKVYQRMRRERTSERELASEADMLMSSDILFARLDTSSASFGRQQRGWPWRRRERSETVGHWRAEFYEVAGLRLRVRKRREHLTADDVRKNKEIVERLAKGNVAQSLEFEERPSLQPPPRHPASWQQYLQAGSAYLGRSPSVKDSSRCHACRLAMAEDFPLDVRKFLELLRLLAPFKQFNRLREFLQNQLPPGFPVKIEMPVYPTITAQVSFQRFEERNDLTDAFFSVPAEYRQSRHRFRNL